MRVAGRRGPDDGGSVLLLTIGYAVLAMVTVLVCVDATSLYLAQKDLDGLADATALASSDGFVLREDGGVVHATLTSEGVRTQAGALLVDSGAPARLISAATPDGRSARVTLSTTWHPPVATLFVPSGIALFSTATSRVALSDVAG